MKLEKDLNKISSKIIKLIIAKNKDYGDAYKKQGLIGILIRIQDKINRAINIEKNKIVIIDENLEDTIIDLIGYSMLYLCENNVDCEKKTKVKFYNLSFYNFIIEMLRLFF